MISKVTVSSSSGYWIQRLIDVCRLPVIDVGCAALIADGKVKVKQGVEIDHLEKDSVILTDGAKLEADAIILAYCICCFVTFLPLT